MDFKNLRKREANIQVQQLLFKMAAISLLFLLLFVTIRGLGLAMLKQRAARVRLAYIHTERWSNRFNARLARYRPIYKHLTDLLETTRIIRSLSGFLIVTLLLFFTGIVLGAIIFQSVRGVMILSMILASSPYLILRIKLISIHLQTRIDFLPAVEIFYQTYLLSVHKNMRSVLQTTVSGNRLLYPVKPLFDQLNRDLSAGREPEDCLRIFSLSLGHIWGDYFTNILRMGLQEGVDVSGSLKELIADMRRSQLYDQKARNRLLEIRLASFSPVLFLSVFVGINFKVNYMNAYRFYVLDPDGRNMLLNAVFLIFGSFLMGIYLSMKRM